MQNFLTFFDIFCNFFKISLFCFDKNNKQNTLKSQTFFDKKQENNKIKKSLSF